MTITYMRLFSRVLVLRVRNFEVLVVRGVNHPSAHLHAHKQRQMKEALENSCSLIVATKHYAQRTTATTTTTTTTTIKEYLVKLNATYIETMEVRKSKWRILLPTPEDWRKVFVAGKFACGSKTRTPGAETCNSKTTRFSKTRRTFLTTFGTRTRAENVKDNWFRLSIRPSWNVHHVYQEASSRVQRILRRESGSF